MRKILLFAFLFCLSNSVTLIANSNQLPTGFVYLKDIDPTIVQDMRYATYYNFIGRPIKGYETGECILTKPTALALAKVQKELHQATLSLKVLSIN
jgi:D-alanyl-D-alanine dipeptidase